MDREQKRTESERLWDIEVVRRRRSWDDGGLETAEVVIPQRLWDSEGRDTVELVRRWRWGRERSRLRDIVWREWQGEGETVCEEKWGDEQIV